MKQAALWIDHHEAHIFHYSPDGIHEKAHAPEVHGRVTKEHLKKFYHEVAEALKGTDKLVVMGPGLAKQEFMGHCESHHPTLFKKVLKVEAINDHVTREEMLNVANKCFKEYHNWEGIR